jgi:hypothetical protein
MADHPFDDLPESEPAWPRPRFSDGAEPAAPGRRRTEHELRGRYRALRALFLRQWAAEGAECWFGDGVLDYSLAHGDPRAATVHHTIPVALLPDLELETSLWRPSHALCNKLGQAAFAEAAPTSEPEPDTGWPSQIW